MINMAIGDIIEARLFGTLFGQLHLNVFTYQIDTQNGPADYDGIADATWDILVPAVQQIATADLTFERVEVDNVTDGLSFGSFASSATGTVAGNAFSPFATWYFRYNRSTKITRSGGKRFGGVAEVEVADGVAVTSFLPTLSAAANDLEQSVTWLNPTDPTNAVGMSPVIVGRKPAGGYDLARVNKVESVQYVSVSTQNSRKFGRGS